MVNFPPKGHQAINDLDDYAPPFVAPCPTAVSLVDHYIDSKGVKRVKGNSRLKQSQSYPRQLLICIYLSAVFYFVYIVLLCTYILLNP